MLTHTCHDFMQPVLMLTSRINVTHVVPRRFNQLHAMLLSNDDAAVAAGQNIGFLRAAALDTAYAQSQLRTDEGQQQQQHAVRLPKPASLAALAATTLGKCTTAVAFCSPPSQTDNVITALS